MAMIDDGTVVRNAEQLLTTEKGIAALPMRSPDASLKRWLPRSVQSEELIAQGKALVKQSPVR